MTTRTQTGCGRACPNPSTTTTAPPVHAAVTIQANCTAVSVSIDHPLQGDAVALGVDDASPRVLTSSERVRWIRTDQEVAYVHHWTATLPDGSFIDGTVACGSAPTTTTLPPDTVPAVVAVVDPPLPPVQEQPVVINYGNDLVLHSAVRQIPATGLTAMSAPLAGGGITLALIGALCLWVKRIR